MRIKTRTLAYLAVLSALGTVFEYLSSVLPTGQLGFLALASLCGVAAVIESGAGGGIAAFIVMMLGITLPAPIVNTIGTLSDATAPIAMILLGAALNIKGFSSDRWRIAVCTIGKLVFFPAFGIAGAVLLGIRDVQLIAVTLMTAAPDALASYAMASSMGGNGKLAGELVVITTITSCFTIPVFLFILKTNGLF